MFVTILIIACSLLWGMPTAADALTAEEVLLLKQNGVSEETIQMMIASEMRALAAGSSASQPGMGVATIPRPGGRKAIVYSTGQSDHNTFDAAERLKEERAWEMLRYLIVDTRDTKE